MYKSILQFIQCLCYIIFFNSWLQQVIKTCRLDIARGQIPPTLDSGRVYPQLQGESPESDPSNLKPKTSNLLCLFQNLVKLLEKL